MKLHSFALADAVLAMLMAMVFGVWVGWQAHRLRTWVAVRRVLQHMPKNVPKNTPKD